MIAAPESMSVRDHLAAAGLPAAHPSLEHLFSLYHRKTAQHLSEIPAVSK
jgi:hypothetical protein